MCCGAPGRPPARAGRPPPAAFPGRALSRSAHVNTLCDTKVTLRAEGFVDGPGARIRLVADQGSTDRRAEERKRSNDMKKARWISAAIGTAVLTAGCLFSCDQSGHLARSGKPPVKPPGKPSDIPINPGPRHAGHFRVSMAHPRTV